MGYSKASIIESIKNVEESKWIYQAKQVNYKGLTSDTHEPYTEVIAEYLLNTPVLKDKIQSVHRHSSYFVNHSGQHNNQLSNREEEIIAIQMFLQNNEYDHIGKIVDYQVPLKDKRSDVGLGKIDLVSSKGNDLFLLELKKPDSTETLLRCVLEAYTYSQILDEKKFLKDFKFPQSKHFRKAAFVFKNGFQHLQYEDKSRNRNVLELMQQLSVEIFTITQQNEKYQVALP